MQRSDLDFGLTFSRPPNSSVWLGINLRQTLSVFEPIWKIERKLRAKGLQKLVRIKLKMYLSENSNMKPVPMIKPKYIFLAGWFLTSIFILLNCHYGWNGTNMSEVFYFDEESDENLRKIILLVTFMRSGSSFIGEFFNLHPGKNNFNSINSMLTKDVGDKICWKP